MVRNYNGGVPVVMYHSIMPRKHAWSPICISLDLFENQLRWLRNEGFVTIRLNDLHDYVSGYRQLPGNVIVLTFDDGYLDNWVYASSLLKKYGFCATIFPSLEFISDGKVRPRAIDPDFTGEDTGYLNWNELRAMIDEGTFDVQSHSMTHTWYFKGPAIVDFYSPTSNYSWIEWNEKPENKPSWRPNSPYCPDHLGYCVFEYGRALGVRRFFPKNDLQGRLASFVNQHGGKIFFNELGWRGKLQNEVTKICGAELGRFETDDEFRKRIDYELGYSRTIIQEKLGVIPEYLCWPGGAIHPITEQVWKSYGYKASTLPSSSTMKKINMSGEHPDRIRRIGCFSSWEWHGINYEPSARGFGLLVRSFMGDKRAKILFKLDKLLYIITNRRGV